MAVLSQTVLLSSVLFYFGWVRTQATWGYFGIDVGLLGYSTADFALRSINATFLPLIGIGVVALLAVAFHRGVLLPAVLGARTVRGRRIVETAIRAAHALGTAALAALAIGLLVPPAVSWAPAVTLPLVLLLSAGLLAYADRLRAAQRPASPGKPGLRPLILAVLALIGLLWCVAAYARRTGEAAAAGVAAGLPSRPAVTLYSAERLAIAGPGVVVAPLAQPDAKYKFRYSGLVLLQPVQGRYLLLAAHWRKGVDPVYVVPAGDDVRMDIVGR
ncbi:hypothetical protein [Amycolatopsis sp. Hca4]|uniref:hypothetical protein n=1 Tax=Amycolatopsis sp. Hca4 TaxID=2742131 RepID=UPI00158FA3C2|nr:hypothetical protein [Amycolatopsis sp. Hca4]QKV79888.1 hypothetical protein HUT10_43375 [Amycolatopsis sp. Hca4]